MLNDNDELRIYRGTDYVVQKHIVIHQPTLGEICDYGEKDYYSMVYNITATPQNMKFQLWDSGIDYTKITPWQLYYSLLYQVYTPKETGLLFGDLDFTKFKLAQRNADEAICLYQQIETDDGIDEVVIDEDTYNTIVDYFRKVHNIEKDERVPGNESTKMILIDDARDDYEYAKTKPYRSVLLNLISAMVNSEGFKYSHAQVWNMPINAFMDSVKRIAKIKRSDLLMQSGYSGFGVALDKIDKKQLDWLGELD